MKPNLHPYVEVECEPCVVCDATVDPQTGICRECSHDNWAERITRSDRPLRSERVERVTLARSREESEGHVVAAWLGAWPGLVLLFYELFHPGLGMLLLGALFVPVLVSAINWVGVETLDDDRAAWRFARVLAYGAGVTLVGLGIAAGLMGQAGALFALLPLAYVVTVIVRRKCVSPTTAAVFFLRLTRRGLPGW